MAHSIKTVYVVHHSHTDIGYTDLQERVIAIQVNYIKTVLSMMRQPEYADFRWNCETLYCVEEFWKQASEEDRADFARFVKEGKIGISANYLNFNDLVNADVFGKRLAKWQDKLQPFGTKIHTAMAADVNGFSMGYRDAMIENGVEFFFTNVHCHHGMYPLYQNQNAFFWENASGQRLLVWNGEHYNLGNVLGLQPNHAVNWMMRNRLGEDAVTAAAPFALVIAGRGDGFFPQQFRNIFVGFFLGAAKVEELVAQTDQRFPIILVHGFQLRHVLHDDGTENATGTHGGQCRQECIFWQGNVRVLVHEAMHRHRQTALMHPICLTV